VVLKATGDVGDSPAEHAERNMTKTVNHPADTISRRTIKRSPLKKVYLARTVIIAYPPPD
jgi:hypothetical protein